MFGNVNVERAAQKMSGGVVNLMVGYLFVLYKGIADDLISLR